MTLENIWQQMHFQSSFTKGLRVLSKKIDLPKAIKEQVRKI
jgi:hypothetical protein